MEDLPFDINLHGPCLPVLAARSVNIGHAKALNVKLSPDNLGRCKLTCFQLGLQYSHFYMFSLIEVMMRR